VRSRSLVGDLLDGAAEHVGEDLAPHVRTRATADEPDRLQSVAGEALDSLEQPARIAGSACVV
jgi:hypothetical protein